MARTIRSRKPSEFARILTHDLASAWFGLGAFRQCQPGHAMSWIEAVTLHHTSFRLEAGSAAGEPELCGVVTEEGFDLAGVVESGRVEHEPVGAEFCVALGGAAVDVRCKRQEVDF